MLRDVDPRRPMSFRQREQVRRYLSGHLVVLFTLGEPRWNCKFAFNKLKQFPQRIATPRQAQHPIVYVFIRFPSKKVPGLGFKGFHTIRVCIGPNHAVFFF